VATDRTAGVLLEGAYVLCLDGTGRAGDGSGTAGFLSVAVEDGVIQAIDRRSALRRRFPHARRVSCRDRILMPGLINAHLHPELHVLKGELEERSLHDWHGAQRFNAAVDFLGTEDGAPLQATAIRAALAEAVLGGTTCVGTYGVSMYSEARCEAALHELGIRGTVTLRDRRFEPVPGAAGGTAWDRPTPAMYRLHAEERLDTAELEAAARAHQRGERIVMHAAETEHRLHLVRQRFGTTTIRLLERYGLLSPRVLLSHAVFVDDEEIELIARSGTAVVVSPAAEMKLADGIPPVQAMHRRGVTVALGTDAAVCNNGTDMFLEMRLLGMSQKLRYGADAAPAEQILLMATRAGAAALGAAGRFGAVAPGLAADVILVDTRNPRLQPLLVDDEQPNIAANLVYAATGTDVTDVMVGGRWIVRRRRLLTTDARRLWVDLAQAARTMHARLLRKR
jgi:5-methylthioadenosine/S-adenosylhomocysteine deaminase